MPVRSGRRPLMAGAAMAGLARLSPARAASHGGAETLDGLARAHGRLFGMMVTQEHLERSPALAAIVAAQAGMVVPGLELKWPAVHPSPETFDFTGADAVVGFGRAHGLLARGHTLIWHETLPDWVIAAPASQMPAILARHIGTVCGRYAGRMHSWDVANEVLNTYDGQPGGLRASPFYKALGPSYIELGFRLAAAADPAAILTLNEYDLEMDNALHARRRVAMLELLNRLVQRGVPVHALGIQAHLTPGRIPFDPGIFRSFIRAVASLGLQVFVTEMDVIDRLLPADIAVRDAAAAAATRDYLAVALSEPSVRLVVTWGVSDRFTWVDINDATRRTDGLPSRPHLYDADMRPKPLWHAVADALRDASVGLKPILRSGPP